MQPAVFTLSQEGVSFVPRPPVPTAAPGSQQSSPEAWPDASALSEGRRPGCPHAPWPRGPHHARFRLPELLAQPHSHTPQGMYTTSAFLDLCPAQPSRVPCPHPSTSIPPDPRTADWGHDPWVFVYLSPQPTFEKQPSWCSLFLLGLSSPSVTRDAPSTKPYRGCQCQIRLSTKLPAWPRLRPSRLTPRVTSRDTRRLVLRGLPPTAWSSRATLVRATAEWVTQWQGLWGMRLGNSLESDAAWVLLTDTRDAQPYTLPGKPSDSWRPCFPSQPGRGWGSQGAARPSRPCLPHVPPAASEEARTEATAPRTFQKVLPWHPCTPGPPGMRTKLTNDCWLGPMCCCPGNTVHR